MTDEQINEFITENYLTMQNKEICTQCGIKIWKFYAIAKILGLCKKPQIFWTKEENETLKRMWFDKSKRNNEGISL